MTECFVCQKIKKLKYPSSVGGHYRIDFGRKMTGHWSRWTGGSYTQHHYIVKMLWES